MIIAGGYKEMSKSEMMESSPGFSFEKAYLEYTRLLLKSNKELVTNSDYFYKYIGPLCKRCLFFEIKGYDRPTTDSDICAMQPKFCIENREKFMDFLLNAEESFWCDYKLLLLIDKARDFILTDDAKGGKEDICNLSIYLWRLYDND